MFGVEVYVSKFLKMGSFHLVGLDESIFTVLSIKFVRRLSRLKIEETRPAVQPAEEGKWILIDRGRHQSSRAGLMRVTHHGTPADRSDKLLLAVWRDGLQRSKGLSIWMLRRRFQKDKVRSLWKSVHMRLYSVYITKSRNGLRTQEQ